MQETIDEDTNVGKPMDPTASLDIAGTAKSNSDIGTVASATLQHAIMVDANKSETKRKHSEEVAATATQVDKAAKKLRSISTVENRRRQFKRAWSSGKSGLLNNDDITNQLDLPPDTTVKDCDMLREFFFNLFWPPQSDSPLANGPIEFHEHIGCFQLSIEWQKCIPKYAEMRDSINPNEWDTWHGQVFILSTSHRRRWCQIATTLLIGNRFGKPTLLLVQAIQISSRIN
jgi:hypothetical protein